MRFNQLDGDELEAVHEVYTAFTDPDQPAAEEPKPEPYMVQVASLGPLVEDPPTRLRTTAIEPRRPDPPGPMADQTFFQKLTAEVVSFFELIADVLGDDAARASR